MRRYLPFLLLPIMACAPITSEPQRPTLVLSWGMAEGIIKEDRVRKVHFLISKPPIFTLEDGSQFISTPPNGMRMKEAMPYIHSFHIILN